MAELPKGRRRKKPARAKTAFKKDGTANLKARIPFYGHDPEHHKLYDLKAWRRIRKLVLADYPVCPVCMQRGKVVEATEVDHITAHGGDLDLFSDMTNLWAMCHRCHLIKTNLESQGVTKPDMIEWTRLLIEHLGRQ